MKRILLSVFAAAITAVWVAPATAQSDISFDGSYRARGEFRQMPQFQDTNQTQSIILQRVRLTANAKATEDTSVKITLQDSWDWGAGTHTTGGPGLTDGSRSNHLDLHESYVNITNVLGQPVDLRVGRQELNYGDQRLIGAFGWNNNGRSFDAVKLTHSNDTLNLDLFYSKISEATTGLLPNSNGAGDADQDFYGAYATVKSIPNNTVDLYVLFLRDGSTTQMATTNLHTVTVGGTQALWTYGARVKGNFNAIDYTGELAFQSGTIPTTGANDLDLAGLAYALKAGYTLPTEQKVRVGAQYVFASGDDNSGDNELGTFSNLFPTNHGHMGIADQQAWRNVNAWAIEGSAQINEKLSVMAAYWSFKLAEKQDDWYHAGRWMTAESGITARLSDGVNDDAGTEIDLVANYKYNSAVSAQLGYARFSAGDLPANRVLNEEDMDFAYLQLLAKF